MQRRRVAFCFAVIAATAASVQAQPTAIEHKGVACIVVAKYPKLKACFGGEVIEPRAYFHAEGVRDWFWVKMGKDAKDAPEPGCYAGILPKPSRKLINKHIEYYLEVVDKSQRTPEYDPLVVRQAQQCKKDAPVAPVSPTGPVAVFPALPAGFALGSFPTAAVVGGTLAAAGAAGLAVANNGTTTTTTSSTTPAAPVTTPTTLPSPGTPPAPFALSCQADPHSGLVPLTVTFTAFASGGTGSYDYDWRFGDGATGIGRHPVHTYTSTGTFGVLLIATSGDLVRQCERSITVNEPVPPPPPPPSEFSLSVAKTGTGSGTVTDDKSKISCGPTCSATYLKGTKVILSAAPSSGSTFKGWGGDCSGNGVCTVTMDSAHSVTAQFDTVPPSILTFNAAVESGYDCPLPLATFNITPPNKPCVPARLPSMTTCSNTYTPLTSVTITAPADTCGDKVCWRGACLTNNNGDTPGSKCTLSMSTDKTAGVLLNFPNCTGITSAEPATSLTWSIELDAPGAIGQSVVDGQVVVAESGRHAQHMARSREGEIVVAAQLVKADGKPGIWRFEAQGAEAIEPGSLRVLQGDVALLTPTSVVFRLKGNAGERVSFSYRLRR